MTDEELRVATVTAKLRSDNNFVVVDALSGTDDQFLLVDVQRGTIIDCYTTRVDADNAADHWNKWLEQAIDKVGPKAK